MISDNDLFLVIDHQSIINYNYKKYSYGKYRDTGVFI